MERALQPPSPEQPMQPVEQEPFEYKLLTGHARTDGTWKSTQDLQREYVRLTDDLVYQMTDGIKVTNRETGEEEVKKPDYVVWLDKSARPLAWLTRDLWPTLAADAEGAVPTMPQMRFVNIDREQWLSTVDPAGTNKMNVDAVHPDIIRSLRSIFVQDKSALPETIDDTRIDDMETELDGKTVLIVDEVRSSGRTLEIARKFFERAFPDASVATTHWMGGSALKGGASGNADLPVWYRSDTELGRGVGDRDTHLSQKSPNRIQNLGRWFLSTKLRGPDSLSSQLRTELKQLAEDVREHKVLVVPSIDREIDDVAERAQRLNDMTLPEYREERQKNQLDTARHNPSVRKRRS